MLINILTTVVSVIANVVVHRIQMWWAQRQAEYYRYKAELEKKRLESLKVGKAVEEDIVKAGSAAADHEHSAATWDEKVAELARRAEARNGGPKS